MSKWSKCRAEGRLHEPEEVGKWGKCRAEGRLHELSDFKSQAVIHKGKIIGHSEVCRWCGKNVKELFQK